MLDRTSEEALSSLSKTKRTCGRISVAMKIALCIFCFWWIYTSVLMCNALVSHSALNDAASVSAPGLITYLLHCAVVLLIGLILVRVFSDSARGESPFTLMQVKRLRITAALLILYTVAEFAVSLGASFMIASGSAIGQGGSVVTLDAAPIVAAAVIFAFSFVFKYGVLLQELSDETL